MEAETVDSVELANRLLVHGIGAEQVARYVTEATRVLIDMGDEAGVRLRAFAMLAGMLREHGVGGPFDLLMREYGSLMLAGVEADSVEAREAQHGFLPKLEESIGV